MKNYLTVLIAAIVLEGCLHEGSETSMQTGKDYPVYGGNKAGNRYSPLDQINTTNISNLELAWIYDAREGTDTADPLRRVREIQCQPIVVNGILYGTTAELNLFAVNAGTGKQVWKFEPVKNDQKFNTNRGVMYWENGDDKRILYSAGANLYAIDALTGMPVTEFGKNGIVDLHEGLGTNLDHDVTMLSVSATTPGVIYKNTLIIGSSVTEQGDAAPGHVRAFDVVTGKLKWVFHTIPQPGEPGYETWPKDAYKVIGAANNWSGLTVDEKRGLVFFGTGSPSSDYYGGDRAGMNLYSDCIMALEAETGKMKWYYQTTHHDLWDRDMTCPPNLAVVKHDGKAIDAVVQATKDGLIYVLDRETGQSLFPVEERPVPTNGLPGEHPYPTQKYPLKPLPLHPQLLTEDNLTDISPESNAFVKTRFNQLPPTTNKYMPPSVEGTILYGYSGGAEWGGNSVDPDGILYQNTNSAPWILQMIDRKTRDKELASLSQGNALYVQNCASCHGADRRGGGNSFPSLVDIDKRRTPDQLDAIVKAGSGRMPSFQHIPEAQRMAIVDYILNRAARTASVADGHTETIDTSTKKSNFPYQPAYVYKYWRPFVDQDGYNAQKPPWGTLNAIDLNTGDYLWRVPLGEFPELTKKGIPITGSESYGGPVTTAGGLIFIAGTRDERIRAFDKKTGKVLWEYQLPAGGFATPVTYEIDGRQYVAIAAGGARGKKAGGWYVAFALKKN